MADITSANAIFMLTVPGVFGTAVQVQGFAVDDAFDIESVEPGETRMGVDGIFSAGVVPVPYPMTITLQADSTSAFLFETWEQAEQTFPQQWYPGQATITLTSIARKYSFFQGKLMGFVGFPGAKKVLAQRQFRITWGVYNPAPIV